MHMENKHCRNSESLGYNVPSWWFYFKATTDNACLADCPTGHRLHLPTAPQQGTGLQAGGKSHRSVTTC